MTKTSPSGFSIYKVVYMNTNTGYFFERFSKQMGQYHLPLGFVAIVNPTQPKWNHSISQSVLSQPIISPYETCLHRQYVGSFGSTGMSKTTSLDGANVKELALISTFSSLIIYNIWKQPLSYALIILKITWMIWKNCQLFSFSFWIALLKKLFKENLLIP